MKNTNGISLIEVLMAIGLGAVISIFIASLYLAHFKVFNGQNISIDLTSQTKIVIDDIISHVRESDSVVLTCSACSGDTTGADILILRLWPIDNAGESIDPQSTNYDYVLYKRDTGETTNLIRKIYANAVSYRRTETKILANAISNLQFTYNNADPTQATEVATTIAAQKSSLGKTFTADQQQKAMLRNK